MQNSFLFLHLPKTAGSSMRHHPLIQNSHIIHPISPRGAWEEILTNKWYNTFKIAFVRNPWDRFVSLYFYFYNMTPTHFAYKYDHQTVDNVKRFKSFNEFCKNFSDFDQNQPFKKFHFFPQHLWTHHNNKEFVDFLGKYEDLAEDMCRLEKTLGYSHTPLPHSNKSKHSTYKDYYNAETREIVEKLYKKDITLYNYTFNE